MISEYTIQVTRRYGEFIASIPELCLAVKGRTPQEAISAILQSEEAALKTLEEQGVPLPPAAHLIDPFPKLTRWIARNFSFFARVAIGYVFVVCITMLLLAIAAPSVRSRVEDYVLSQKASTDAGKVLSKFGVSLCLEKP